MIAKSLLGFFAKCDLHQYPIIQHKYQLLFAYQSRLQIILLKPRQIQGLRACLPSAFVTACIGDGERKKGNFGGEMVKLEKVRYGSNSKQKRWKACKYWGFWIASLRSQ